MDNLASLSTREVITTARPFFRLRLCETLAICSRTLHLVARRMVYHIGQSIICVESHMIRIKHELCRIQARETSRFTRMEILHVDVQRFRRANAQQC
ncbi:hypothetical protein M3J09_013531 [Ascochyta lentis]